MFASAELLVEIEAVGIDEFIVLALVTSYSDDLLVMD